MNDSLDLVPWIALGVLAALLLLLGLARLVFALKRIELRPEAGVLETLQRTPLLVALFLDVNDLVLDSFGAPIAWVVLARLGLAPLKKVAVVEALIPGTQLLPLFTLAWLFARVVRTRPRAGENEVSARTGHRTGQPSYSLPPA